MEKTPFYNVHKDFAQEGPVYGHEEFYGLPYDPAYAKYHEMARSAYLAKDPWTHVYIEDDNGVRLEWVLIDRRVRPEPEPIEEQELQ